MLNPDPYRGRFGNDGAAYAEDVDDVIRHATSGRVAGFISESVQGVGGTIPLADGYLPKVYEVGIRGFNSRYSPNTLLTPYGGPCSDVFCVYFITWLFPFYA